MNLPNKLTLGRLILIPFFVLAFYLNFPGHYLVSLAIFGIAAFTDFLDGHIARKYNMVTDLGKFLDPIAREMAVSSLRMLAAKNGKVLAADKSGKIKTFFTDITIVIMLFAGDFLVWMPKFGRIVDMVGLVCFGISVLLTIISGISYLVKNKEAFKE